jgi:tRNA(fMet)-specific endonuclease VapC
MMYLLDTNACITYLRRPTSRVRREVAAQPPTDLFLCSIVLAELYRGALRSANSIASRASVDKFAAPYAALPFDGAAADIHAQVRVFLERRGQMIGHYDLQIAAIALSKNLTLVTHNTNEFSRVPGLAIEDWETP